MRQPWRVTCRYRASISTSVSVAVVRVKLGFGLNANRIGSATNTSTETSAKVDSTRYATPIILRYWIVSAVTEEVNQHPDPIDPRKADAIHRALLTGLLGSVGYKG